MMKSFVGFLQIILWHSLIVPMISTYLTLLEMWSEEGPHVQLAFLLLQIRTERIWLLPVFLLLDLAGTHLSARVFSGPINSSARRQIDDLFGNRRWVKLTLISAAEEIVFRWVYPTMLFAMLAAAIPGRTATSLIVAYAACGLVFALFHGLTHPIVGIATLRAAFINTIAVLLWGLPGAALLHIGHNLGLMLMDVVEDRLLE